MLRFIQFEGVVIQADLISIAYKGSRDDKRHSVCLEMTVDKTKATPRMFYFDSSRACDLAFDFLASKLVQ